MAERKTYVCRTEHCTLGTLGSPGKFSGGITKEQVNLLTGRPLEELKSGVDFGPGFCPNCAKPGDELTAEQAQKEALADAKAAYDAQVAEIKGAAA